MHTTNYNNTLITASADFKGYEAKTPKDNTIAALQLDAILSEPYELTSDDLLFIIHAKRHNIDISDKIARADFFANPKACLRCSPLVKTHGYGIHHNKVSKIAAFALDSDMYKALLEDETIKKVAGMRSSKK